MATNYQRGYAFENKIVNFFRGKGFFAVRTAGSHTPVDVIAWDEDSFYLIQAKAGKMGKSEILAAMGALIACVISPPLRNFDSLHREVWVKGDGRQGDWFTRYEA